MLLLRFISGIQLFFIGALADYIIYHNDTTNVEYIDGILGWNDILLNNQPNCPGMRM
jgi:hypothetical protein